LKINNKKKSKNAGIDSCVFDLRKEKPPKSVWWLELS